MAEPLDEQESDAQAHVLRLAPDAATRDRLCAFADLLRQGAARQNLISAATLPMLWQRHLADSAQLVPLAAGAPPGLWVDIGSGAGLPGLVAAILTDRPVLLVEPRRLRVAFLEECIGALDLAPRVTVAASRIERVHPPAPVAILSARAVASLPDLLAAAGPLAQDGTRWLLPKGAGWRKELALLPRAWQERFAVTPSQTHPDAAILTATGRFAPTRKAGRA